jgi:hypothetical protein
MRILSVDPGPVESAWVLMAGSDISTARVGKIKSQPEPITFLLNSLTPNILAVESVAAYINPNKSRKIYFTLFQTCVVVGMFEMLAHIRGTRYIGIPANSPDRNGWRNMLCGRTQYQPGDNDVSAVLKALFPGQTQWWNNHIRDAIGLNLVAQSLAHQLFP